MVNQDFSDLLREFSVHRVAFIVVGAHALAAHGHVRATKDLDVWVDPEPANARRVVDALRAFGAPLLGLTERDLCTPGVVFQIGVEPVRIDILTHIDGVSFSEAWSEKVDTKFAGIPVAVLSKRLLVQNKRASGRTQDLADIERLENPSDS